MKYIKELIIILIQLFMFYLFPLVGNKVGAIGMVFLILCGTFILSILIGVMSEYKIKYLYPIIISVIFIPSIWIYYNESALVHSLWYLVVSIVGIFIGVILSKIRK